MWTIIYPFLATEKLYYNLISSNSHLKQKFKNVTSANLQMGKSICKMISSLINNYLNGY